MRAALKALGEQIAAEFKNAVISAFNATWIAAGSVALLGLASTRFTSMQGEKKTTWAQEGEPVEEGEVHAVS